MQYPDERRKSFIEVLGELKVAKTEFKKFEEEFEEFEIEVKQVIEKPASAISEVINKVLGKKNAEQRSDETVKPE